MAMLNLPLALRRTIMVLYKLEKATADDLAKETKRLRAMESAAANELVRMGYIKKKREGRDVYFYIETPEEKAYG
jgi:ArsR family transcriptional regulator, lead/cadmium/zinc/bismuth-responsive transcriptional repressor